MVAVKLWWMIATHGLRGERGASVVLSLEQMRPLCGKNNCLLSTFLVAMGPLFEKNNCYPGCEHCGTLKEGTQGPTVLSKS